MFKIYADETPNFSLFHGNPKFKWSGTTRSDDPASGNGVGGPAIYPPEQNWETFFSLYAPEGCSTPGGRGDEG